MFSSSRAARSIRCAIVAAFATLACAASASAAQPTFVSSSGVTVTKQTQLGEQLLDLQVSTPAVSPKATGKGNGIRVILPKGYETSGTKRYPVIYLLHGFSLSYNIWTDAMPAGTIETLIGNREVILVMPDGGRGGWYTDWIDQSVAQKWETYHTKQLVPFIDANLRTIANRNGRTISGYSMGGYGAVHYAESRPDLFGTVASMSGALNLRDPAIVTAVTASGMYGLNAFGAFGLPFWPFDAKWYAASAFGNPGALRNTNVFLTAAQSSPSVRMSSTNIAENAGMKLVEGVVRASSSKFHELLNSVRIPNSYVNFGAPGVFTYGYCDGGHNAGCAAYAMEYLLPRLLASMSPAV